MEAAVGIEKRANVVTRGWYHLDPGQCRQVMDGTLDADMVYLHARTPSVYGSAPLPQNGNADFCIRNGDFDNCQRARMPGEPAGALHAGATVRYRRKGRSSISRKKPTTMTPRRGLPASSACS